MAVVGTYDGRGASRSLARVEVPRAWGERRMVAVSLSRRTPHGATACPPPPCASAEPSRAAAGWPRHRDHAVGLAAVSSSAALGWTDGAPQARGHPPRARV